MPARRPLSGFAVVSLLTTIYWLPPTAFAWGLDPLVSPAYIFVYAGCGLLFAASLLLRPVAVSVEFDLKPRKRSHPTAGPPKLYDRVLASVTLALVFVGAMGIPFVVGFISGVLGMRQTGRSRHAVRGYALAATCSLLSFLGAPLFLAGNVQLARTENEAIRTLQQCKRNVRELATISQAHGRSWDAHRWCDVALRDLSRKDTLVCPAAPELECGYAFNAALDRLPRRLLDRPSNVIVVFESDAGWNAAGGPELLPDEPRHRGSDNYGFADGHAEWIKRKQLPDGTWAKEPNADVTWEPVLKESEAEPPSQADS